jgi:aminopeptidase-like protein
VIGYKIHSLANELWKINRSITGEGVRETLSCIKKYLQNLNVRSVPSGTKVFDWTVPNEWHVSDAYIITPEGNKICDFLINNLHI